MEMTLNLTFEDGLKVVEAMKNVAIENGWDAEELDECGVIEEYSYVIDAALTAMGININIDANPSYEEDEDEDEEENTLPTAKDDFIQQYMDSGFSLKEAQRVADDLFNEEEEEEEEEEEDDDEELPSDAEVFQMIKRLLGGL